MHRRTQILAPVRVGVKQKSTFVSVLITNVRPANRLVDHGDLSDGATRSTLIGTRSEYTEDNRMGTRIVAHRGFSGAYPENTMAAFRAAEAAGAEMIEMDVQLSRDGEPVVFHDERLERVCGVSGYVNDYSWEELRQLDAGRHFGAQFAGERIPHFDEFLDFVAPTMLTLNVELKNEFLRHARLEEIVLERLHARGLAERTILSSFNHESMRRVSTLDPGVRTGLIYAGRLHEPWDYARPLGARALHLNWKSVDSYIVEGAHRAGLEINTYTVNEVVDMRRLLALGVDGIITNWPDRLAKVVRGGTATE